MRPNIYVYLDRDDISRFAFLTLACPLMDASCSGVSLSRPCTLTSAPHFRSDLATSSQPWLHASCRGVQPGGGRENSRLNHCRVI